LARFRFAAHFSQTLIRPLTGRWYFFKGVILDTAITHSNKMDIKSTLKISLVLLPIFGLLLGVGLGLILGTQKFETTFDIYIKVATVLLPTVSLLILALTYYFKEIDSL
jgi:hypothetical protein